MTFVKLGDGIAGLGSLEPSSIGLILSDLPSGETRAAFDRKIHLHSFWTAAWTSLRKNGVVILMASNIKFAAELIESEPTAFKYDMIWHKSVAGGFLNANHRPLRSHEFVLVFSDGLGTYRAQMREGMVPVKSNSGRGSSGENYGASGGGRSRAGATNRFPWSVLQFASVGTSDSDRRHPQQKPEALLRHLVRTYSRPRDIVVDPFAGSGSTGRAAQAEGRLFLGWDSDPRFGKRGNQ